MPQNARLRRDEVIADSEIAEALELDHDTPFALWADGHG